MRTRTVVIILVLIAAAAGVTAIVLPRDGFSARGEPMAVERVVARTARRFAVPRSGRDARNPLPFTPELWAESRAHFADHCAICHGNDGRGDTEIGRSLYPRAPDMTFADTQQLTDGELYWVIENGVRLTGMPAWGDGNPNDPDTWKLVHFVRHLSEMTGDHLSEMEALNPKSRAEFEEELEDKRFLEGKDVKAPTAPQHHHKDQP